MDLLQHVIHVLLYVMITPPEGGSRRTFIFPNTGFVLSVVFVDTGDTRAHKSREEYADPWDELRSFDVPRGSSDLAEFCDICESPSAKHPVRSHEFDLRWVTLATELLAEKVKVREHFQDACDFGVVLADRLDYFWEPLCNSVDP
jgi:hypothetical protein